MKFDKVLVTGGAGLLGRFVVEELEPRCKVSVLDIQSPLHSLPYHEADILDLEAVHAAVKGQDAVVHLAAIDDGRDFPDQVFFQTNVQGTWNVLYAAEQAGVRKVAVAASTAALGLGADRMPDYLPVDEAHPLRPKATYSLTKQVIESVCRSFVERGSLEIVCLRPTLIIRPEREAAVLAQLSLPDPDSEPPADQTSDARDAPYGALSATRTYVRSGDAARCFRMALEYQDLPFDIFNVSAQDSIGRVETLARLQTVYGQLPVIRDPDRYQADPFASVLDNRRARERLGWEPAGDWNTVVHSHTAS